MLLNQYLQHFAFPYIQSTKFYVDLSIIDSNDINAGDRQQHQITSTF